MLEDKLHRVMEFLPHRNYLQFSRFLIELIHTFIKESPDVMLEVVISLYVDKKPCNLLLLFGSGANAAANDGGEFKEYAGRRAFDDQVKEGAFVGSFSYFGVSQLLSRGIQPPKEVNPGAFICALFEHK